MNDNIVVASFTDARHETRTRRVYQYDYGMVLAFSGIDLPVSFEAHFSNTDETGETITQIGADNAVSIPDELLLTGSQVHCWVYLHTGETDGETVYKVTIPVKERAKPSDLEPTPVQQDAITQAIAALNSAVTQTGEDAESAAASASDAADSAEEAKGYKEGAETAAGNGRQCDTGRCVSYTGGGIGNECGTVSNERKPVGGVGLAVSRYGIHIGRHSPDLRTGGTGIGSVHPEHEC